MKKIIVIGITGMFLLTSLTTLSAVGMKSEEAGGIGSLIYGRIKTVDDDRMQCPNADYTSIQDAIDNSTWTGSSAWAKILVYPGLYENIVISGVKRARAKICSVEGPEVTIIDGSGNGDVVKIDSPFVYIEGFMVMNGGEGYCGIKTSEFDTKIINCIVRENAGNGVSASDDSYIIKNCVINNNSGNGVVCKDYSEVYSNVISNNGKSGILVKGFLPEIKNNVISNNDIGINIPASPSAIVATIYHNILMNNNQNAYDEYNYFYGGSLWGGNYWDDYDGVDENPEDGVGDTPYPVGESNKDFYPSMSSENWPNIPPHPPFIGYKRLKLRFFEFTISAKDLDGDDVFIYIDWGDGSNTDWLGPYASGEIIIMNHWWPIGASIIAWAKDVYGAISYGTKAKTTNVFITQSQLTTTSTSTSSSTTTTTATAASTTTSATIQDKPAIDDLILAKIPYFLFLCVGFIKEKM